MIYLLAARFMAPRPALSRHTETRGGSWTYPPLPRGAPPGGSRARTAERRITLR
jgi:hypothetical protein